MSEVTSREGFVPKHLRPEERARRSGLCQWSRIAGREQMEHLRYRGQPECTNPIDGKSGITLCADHIRRVGYVGGMTTVDNARRTFAPGMDYTMQQQAALITRLRAVIIEQGRRLRAQAVRDDELAEQRKKNMVYAVLDGYNVKVGRSAQLATRLRTAYSPSARLLVAYPAPPSEETRIKRRFAHLATHGKEWMAYTPEVSDWVDSMIAEHGEPDPALTCGPAKNSALRKHATRGQITPRDWRGPRSA